MRLIDADALIAKYGNWYTEEGTETGYIGTIKGIVDSTTTIEPEQHWIPTSKECPPEHQEIWITSDLGDVELVYGRDDIWLDEVNYYNESEIVAWMPANVPEPYQPEEE